MRVPFAVLVLGLVATGCGIDKGNQVSQVLLEKETPVLATTNTALEHPRFPLKCEAVGFDGPDGTFEPVTLLTSPVPHGGSQLRPIGDGWPETVKVYRGTNRVAASNHFLGEFQISGFANKDEKSSVEIGFELSAQRELFVYAANVTGGKQYPLQAVVGSEKR